MVAVVKTNTEHHCDCVLEGYDVSRPGGCRTDDPRDVIYWATRLVWHDVAADHREGLPFHCLELQNLTEALNRYKPEES